MPPPKGKKATPGPIVGDALKALLESAKAIVVVIFGVIGIAFLLVNWGKMSDILSGVSRIEAFGFKVELEKKATVTYGLYKRLVDARPDVEQAGRSLSPTEFKAISLRAIWAQPVLEGANVLWVDDQPESNNAEAQLLSYHKVSIYVVRSSEQAMELLRRVNFHLVISDIYRREDAKGPLVECPVYWDSVPDFAAKAYKTTNLAEFNKKYNDSADAGFYLAERMVKELDEKKRPPIIYYSGYEEGIFNPCTNAITNEAYSMMSALFTHLLAQRWVELEKYIPPEPKSSALAEPKAAKQPSDPGK